MPTDTHKNMTTKVFVGYPVSSEVRMHLNQSHAWKLTSIMSKEKPQDLQLIHYHGKDFLGLFFASTLIKLTAIRDQEPFIKDRLKYYCPEFEADALTLTVFPQVFVA